ncbi:hypothetical protein A3D66_00310 [Candidatus Kaiserbacteria bacterium RIFCSPHIGHO2_02_FULL_50_9]|uniref:DUF5652 domain-containing protein n=1 Tax=Candidatus Kaiserbacteria bacterium RIFCSPLOWO2_01_FULL_51_21 TaxID=1798508 RepID=A0A1F6ED71_9BACT|nr:MAG: hypothetical protein A2761_02390 [Candidatus Kaiserbacteria bacterium RIFCSPHIGHO2_01_FULL_51_33]OGG63144.1 MAG: hypothetical protein A3D66_00310 [Candidatus Kaiserbacteria bacterium RIFCSPHIGHO2_02_FULL_50_9]OGG71634.1 MAG: hypothetical protein A3A35_00480 [Candidatus Kaiserbacteria bacterium RIFCSPLOWO2_01_FULL_51_21]
MEVIIPTNLFWLLVLLALWSLPWKGVALWTATKRAEKWWFILLLITNSVAILEIIYLFFIVPRKDAKREQRSTNE